MPSLRRTCAAAGVVSFELTNERAELHELFLARKNDGVTASPEEPPEDAPPHALNGMFVEFTAGHPVARNR